MIRIVITVVAAIALISILPELIAELEAIVDQIIQSISLF